MSIQDLIASASDRLTPTDRRIARVVLANPTLLAFATVSDLAAEAETSRPSIVRFATKLGFEGYTELQNWSRDGVAEQISSPSHRIRNPEGSSSTAVHHAIEGAVRNTFSAIDDDRLRAIAEPLAQAKNVWILSGETSMAGAHTLHSGLSMARADVHLVEERSTGRILSSASPSDAAVVFDFARYRRHTVTACQAIQELGVPLYAVTDSPLSPLASLAEAWFELSIPAIGPFDSSVPAVTAAELLVVEVVKLLGDSARERIDRLEELWQTTGVFLNYSRKPNREL